MMMTLTARRSGMSFAALAALAALSLLAYPSGAGASAVRGTGGGANGAVDAISCASAGNCVAVGHLAPPSRKILFTVTERNGVWGTARVVPGLAALLGSRPSGARFSAVSCPSAGDCAAAGSYSPSAGVTRAFAVAEKKGVWGKAMRVAGLAALHAGRFASVDVINCPSAGNCSAGGSYSVAAGKHAVAREAFVLGEKHGVWGTALKVAGLAKLNTGSKDEGGPNAAFRQISCSSAGNCVAAGFYNGPKGTEPLAVTETHGRWGSAKAFPHIMAINDGHFAELTSVSCPRVRACTAVGFVFFSETDGEVFAISQHNGTWGSITGIPEELPSGDIGSLTCLSVGHCTAGGNDVADLNNPGATQPFIATENNDGTWTSLRLPGVAELSADSMNASVSGVICRSAGSCSAAGTYAASSGSGVFVTAEQNGTWATAIDLPGLAALNLGKGASFPVLSCGAPGDCALGGSYNAGALRKPYLASQHQGAWGQAHEVSGVEP